MNERRIKQIITPQPVMEGAGVLLKRSIATAQLDYVDPFLLFDHFGSDDPRDFIKGFPMHPHRGIETVTYILEGSVEHRDSLGNGGRIGAGDVQWMTSGSGILHEEMPQAVNGRMGGFQLWVNLPARLKMTNPRYQEVLSSKIPAVTTEGGAVVRVIAGNIDGQMGPVTEIYADPIFLDVSMPENSVFTFKVQHDFSLLTYVFEGEAAFGQTSEGGEKIVSSLAMIIYEEGDVLRVESRTQAVRFLLMAALPLEEPIARWGPFVMNTMTEIKQTLRELENGTFIKLTNQGG
jgi:quercetin 2,3-dioxygenase